MRNVAPKNPAFQRRSIAAEDIIAIAISGGDSVAPQPSVAVALGKIEAPPRLKDG
jgi:hypothetical protein